MVANPEDRISRDEAHTCIIIALCMIVRRKRKLVTLVSDVTVCKSMFRSSPRPVACRLCTFKYI